MEIRHVDGKVVSDIHAILREMHLHIRNEHYRRPRQLKKSPFRLKYGKVRYTQFANIYTTILQTKEKISDFGNTAKSNLARGRKSN